MRKLKSAVTAEIVPRDRAQQVDDFTRMVEQLVEQKVADATHGRDALLQPWFQNRDVANAIKRHQTVTEQQKWTHYFEDWGCIICAARRTVAHHSLGMCQRCYSRTVERVRASLRRHAPSPQQPTTFTDTVAIARAALRPSNTLAVRQNRLSARHNRLERGGG